MLRIDLLAETAKDLERSLEGSGFLEDDTNYSSARATSPPPPSPPPSSPLTTQASTPAVLSLNWLDLSGNALPDKECANLLTVVLFSPLCHIESLNLAKNAIGKGKAVVQVLERYVHYRINLNATHQSAVDEDGDDQGAHSIYEHYDQVRAEKCGCTVHTKHNGDSLRSSPTPF